MEQYLFVRFWLGFTRDTDFPFDRFNELPENDFKESLDRFAQSECEERFAALLRQRTAEHSERAKERARQATIPPGDWGMDPAERRR